MTTKIEADTGGLNIVIRPSTKNLPKNSSWVVRWISSGFFFILGIYGVTRLTIGEGASIGLGALGVVAALLGIAATIGAPLLNVLAARNATLFAVDDTVGKTGLFGRRTLQPRGALARIVLQSVVSSGVTTAYAFFVATSGGCLFKLASRQWSLSQLQAFGQRCGVPMEGSWDAPPVTPKDMNRAIPQAFSRLAR